MALSDTGYSQLVTMLKIALPLVALAILSTLFYLARPPDLEQAIPYAEVDIETLAREPRITEPDFSGVTPDGVAVTLRAATARPDLADPARFLAERVEGEINSVDGTRIRLSSIGGVVDTGTGLATMTGDVLVESSFGYAVRTEELRTRLDSSLSESAGPVDIMAPFGHMTAGRLIVTRDPEVDDSFEFVFTDGVQLLYDPGG